MACLQSLKLEIKTLKQMFPKTHARFQIHNATLDELLCRFIDKNGKHYDIHANIMETYPSTPPVWFSESDEQSVINAVQILGTTEGRDNHVILQVGMLLRELCLCHKVPVPSDIDDLTVPIESQPKVISHEAIGDSNFEQNELLDLEPNSESESETECDESVPLELEDLQIVNENDGIDQEHLDTLKALRTKLRQKYAEAADTGSVLASDRLMKELRDIYRSKVFKQKTYSVELVEDSIYNWNICLNSVDSDSPLHSDLLKLKENEGTDYIQLNALFSDKYPFEPPFVRVVHPVIYGGHVLIGGAICMELLTKNGWSSAYNVEAVILQIAATLVEGNARINFHSTENISRTENSLARAQQSYNSMLRVHEHFGWFTPPKNSG
ncbi:ubiquitin-conjugating enzyme E2 Q2 [Drosophila grimshawi]|uniref:GH13122 n=1 Tax=Drosophila grimshawi TaxID=7222 RepID=B4JQT4_DROGR|nr:ubiquitin-conjugating enzyme E2 Q2 [Drosophila grimshawi]EDV99264.1 GH13122 [Drosophila grimshawi]